ncbi:sugar transferase [Planococcus koreensis]|uniref:sugar transferase n=1 Tax=Planococcus koreensis TaxID=112331 RepID=UPI0039FD2DF2
MKVVVMLSISPPDKQMPTTKEPAVHSFEKVHTNETQLYLMSKRFLDIAGSLAGLILLSPLFLIVGMLIKLEDRESPIFFKQKRAGKNGEIFYMYKFRSMVSNAEELKASLVKYNEATGPVFKIRLDPRVTKTGRFLRKTSIDELPQLFNVLKGEMSLVGPRPALPNEVALYNNYEKQRLMITPGLTCLWQINGRSNISFQEWVEMDLNYIRKRCLLLDIKLILKTIIVLFGSKGAY